MSHTEVNLASDNAAIVAPEVMTALAEAAAEPAMPYGNDRFTRRVPELASEIFEREVGAYPVATGTVANALALATLVPPYGSVYCHEKAHIQGAECAAPEFYTGGAKLRLLPGADGKLRPADLEAALGLIRPGSEVHHTMPAAVSITQVTEVGTLYTLDEIRAITDLAHAHGLKVHMDGARFANAVAAMGVSPAELIWKAGLDVLSFGATKNGAMTAEGVVYFDRDASMEFEYRRKRGGHLWSKMRFLSAQLTGYMTDGNWLRYAAAANRAGQKLSAGLARLPGVVMEYPTQANMLFLRMPVAMRDALRDAGVQFYSMGERDGTVGARMVAGFALSDAEIDAVLGVARGYAKAAE